MATLTLSPMPWIQFTDLDGNPVTLGKLWTYEAGTTTPLATYKDVGGLVAHDNPVSLDAGGWATIYLLPQSYKYILKDASGATIKSQDNISAVAPFDVDVDIRGLAGEDIDANDVVYLSDGHGATDPGLWYKADSTAPESSSDAGAIAMAPAAVASGDVGSFRLSGRLTGFIALTLGAKYYVGSTPGSIVTPAPGLPEFTRFVGVADDTGTALVLPTNTSVSASGASGLDIVKVWAFS